MSILEKLGYYNGQVVDVELSPDKFTLCLTEACDLYFSVNLVKSQVKELIEELTEIHNNMEDL